MTACNVKRFIDCTILLMVLGLVLGLAGCSKKAVKASSPGAVSSGETLATSDTGGQVGGSVPSGTPESMTEALGIGDAEGGAQGLVGEGGEISDVEIEILGDDLGGGAGDSGKLLARVKPGSLGLLGERTLSIAAGSGSEAHGEGAGGSHGKGASDPSDGAEQVPEPLVFAVIQPDVLELQVPTVAAVPENSFFVKEGFDDIYFDFDRWAIPQAMQVRLSDHATWLKAHPDLNVLIEGHCDVRGSREYNVVLGEKRARSVRDFLVDLGVPKQRISLLTYGKERLTCFESGEACHQDNRRARLVLK